MSLTSYRAAPPRANCSPLQEPHQSQYSDGNPRWGDKVNGFVSILRAPAAKPGDDLLFQRLSGSTIGAVRFHGRVRDGIGGGTDAMVTKLWRRRARDLEIEVYLLSPVTTGSFPILTVTVRTLKRE